ncbi:MAG: beta-lactamase family protein [Gemmatimonadota bacterium]|nr:beta-lactamase family protein [Gemmatimonadota bacterium]
MLRLVVSALVLLFATPSTSSVTHRDARQRTDLAAAIDSFVDRQVAADSFSGVVLFAAVGARAYQRAVGVANRETGTRMGVDTKVQIASATKLFTQIAIRQLEQAGKLSLSDTVGQFLPAYRNAIVRSRVTVEQLLRHRSGVGSFWNERFLAHVSEIRTVNDYLALFQDDSLLFAPGTDQAYSNGGYVILGAIIERVSGMSYHDYVREHIFAPAGMTETMPYDDRAPRSNVAVGYTFQSLGGVPGGDRRLAGVRPRPGYDAASASQGSSSSGTPSMIIRRPRDTTDAAVAPPPASAGPRLRIMGADGKELSPQEARAAIAQRAASGTPRRSNAAFQASMSGPAGDHYSTVGDFLKLAQALVGRKLLDSVRTKAVLGDRFAQGSDFRANGGGPGSNAEFSIFPSGDVVVVLSNYDPPAATAVAQFIRSRVPSAPR